MGHKAAVAPEPGECPLDNPAPPDNLEPALFVRALDDLQGNPLSGKIGCELIPTVAAIRKDVLDEGKQAAGLLDKAGGAVPVLNVCRDSLDPKQ
jgi:hypothetical protein